MAIARLLGMGRAPAPPIEQGVNSAVAAANAALGSPPVQALADAAASGAMQSWMDPLEGPSRALAAGISGQNPLAAAASQVYDINEQGEMQNVAPTMAQELESRGAHPVVALMADVLLTPDPTGASRLTDLIPLMGLIGPAGLRAMARHGGDLQFLPAGLLNDAAGNLPRRSPAEQTAFRRLISDDPGGMTEPVMLMYDPNTMRFKVGEGNHRVLAALEADSPVPTVFVRGTVRESEGVPIPPRGQEALNALAASNHGYSPGTGAPGQLGLPFYDVNTMIEYAARRAEDGLNPLTDDELEEIADILTGFAAKAQDRTTPLVGPEITRPAQAVPDYTYVMQRVADDATMGETGEQYANRIIGILGPERGRELLMSQTGLNAQELDALFGSWSDARRGFADILSEPTPREAMSPDQEFDLEANLGQLLDTSSNNDFNRLADEGGAIARNPDMPPGSTPTNVDIANYFTDLEVEARNMTFQRVAGEILDGGAGWRNEVDPALEGPIDDVVSKLLDEDYDSIVAGSGDATDVTFGVTSMEDLYDALSDAFGEDIAETVVRSVGVDGADASIYVLPIYRQALLEQGEIQHTYRPVGADNGLLDDALDDITSEFRETGIVPNGNVGGTRPWADTMAQSGMPFSEFVNDDKAAIAEASEIGLQLELLRDSLNAAERIEDVDPNQLEEMTRWITAADQFNIAARRLGFLPEDQRAAITAYLDNLSNDVFNARNALDDASFNGNP